MFKNKSYLDIKEKIPPLINLIFKHRVYIYGFINIKVWEWIKIKKLWYNFWINDTYLLLIRSLFYRFVDLLLPNHTSSLASIAAFLLSLRIRVRLILCLVTISLCRFLVSASYSTVPIVLYKDKLWSNLASFWKKRRPLSLP